MTELLPRRFAKYSTVHRGHTTTICPPTKTIFLTKLILEKKRLCLLLISNHRTSKEPFPVPITSLLIHTTSQRTFSQASHTVHDHPFPCCSPTVHFARVPSHHGARETSQDCGESTSYLPPLGSPHDFCQRT